MKVLILGASSYVGARIYSDLKDKFESVGTYYKNKLFDELFQLDLTKIDKVNEFFRKQNPDVVVHVANFPSPSYAKGREKEFEKLNKDATENVVKATEEINAKLVFISSLAAENPNNIYGKLKFESEKIVKEAEIGYLIIRPSLVFGYSPNTKNPRTFNKILQCIKSKKGEFDTSWKLQPTYLRHISQVVDQSIKKNIWNKIVRLFTGETVTIHKIASDILKNFDGEVGDVDYEIDIPLNTMDEGELDDYELVPGKYEDIIDEVVRDVKENKQVLK